MCILLMESCLFLYVTEGAWSMHFNMLLCSVKIDVLRLKLLFFLEWFSAEEKEKLRIHFSKSQNILQAKFSEQLVARVFCSAQINQLSHSQSHWEGIIVCGAAQFFYPACRVSGIWNSQLLSCNYFVPTRKMCSLCQVPRS